MDERGFVEVVIVVFKIKRIHKKFRPHHKCERSGGESGKRLLFDDVVVWGVWLQK
jgi:hypothetical protein